jgi:hypothetical protein
LAVIGSERTRRRSSERSLGDRCRRADLADAARAHRGGEVVLLLEPLGSQAEHVGLRGDEIGREVRGDHMLRQLDAMAEKLERSTKIGDLAKAAKEAASKARGCGSLPRRQSSPAATA